MLSKFGAALVAFCVFTSGCDKPSPEFPTPTGAPAPTPAPSPQPRPFPTVEFTEIAVGQTVTGVAPQSPPGCVAFPEWPCLYFQVTAPADGILTVELRYWPETQPPGRFGSQGVDISIVDEFGREAWADFATATVTRASIAATADRKYRIVLWYVYADLEYELQVTLKS